MMSKPYEEYAKRFRRLHPNCITILQPHFDPLGFDVRSVKVAVYRRWFSYGVFVLGGTLQCLPGVLDSPPGELIRGHDWNWSTNRGIALWAHEVYHVLQWERNPWLFTRQVLYGLPVSWVKYHEFYAHPAFPFEQEAIEFQHKVSADEWRRQHHA